MPNKDAQHMPGPWRASIPPYGCGTPRIELANGQRLAQLFNATADGTECDANARLIAAAPELLEALKGLLVVYENTRDHKHFGGDEFTPMAERDCAACRARAALAKAGV